MFYSNIWSDIEQVKDAVISIDLNNPNDLANKPLKFLSNKDLEEEFTPKLFTEDTTNSEDNFESSNEEVHSDTLFEQESVEDDEFEIPAFLRKQKF